MKKYKYIIFDLDDTLLDTSTQLIGPAIQEACKAMIKEGLAGNLSDCVHQYYEFAKENLRRDFFSYIVPRQGVKTPDINMRNISRAGRAEFYQPNLPKNLEPIPGSHQLLEKLKSQYTLFLVTAGHIPTQLKKIELLKISNYFSEIRYVDPQKGETKYQTFVEIKNDSHIDTQRILCVGNRLDNEIQAANRLGFDTCFVRFGEHRHQKPIQEMEKPSFIIDHISQIEEICGL